MMRKTIFFAAVLWSCCVVRFASAERTTVLLGLDSAVLGPAVACRGELSVPGGTLVLSPWQHDAKDEIAGTSFTLFSEHNAKTAEAAKLPFARRTTFNKGLILSIDSPAGASLVGKTSLGKLEVPLARLRREGVVGVLEGKISLQRIPNVDSLGTPAAEEEYPSLAVLPDGRTAVAYVAWDGRRDRVLLRVGQDVRPMTDAPGDYLEPRVAVDGAGRLWTIWAANDGHQWDLWARADGPAIRLTRGPANDFWPRLARDHRGELWLAWQTVAADLHYEIMLARLGPEGLGEPQNVSQCPADDWEPALCSCPDGRLVLAWDTYRNGSYDIYLREFQPAADGALTPLGPPRPIAATARREAHATLSADSTGRVWIGWDVACEDWGKHPGGGNTLHSSRQSQVACYAGGKLYRPAAELMDSLPKAWRKFVEYPQVAVDGQDRPWVIFRVENEVRAFYLSPKLRRAQNYGTWHVLASRYDGRRWSPPLLLAESNGRQDMRVEAARQADGSLLVAYGADGRTRLLPYVPVDYNVLLASLAGFGGPAEKLDLVVADDPGRVGTVRPDPELAPLPRSWTIAGNSHRLLLGDTHRHTDISRCTNGTDGSLQDAYRYALDASGLDWLAISDHDQDILKHRNDRRPRPRQDYDWWRSQKYSDLYSIPGRFVALYGYEHGGSYKDRGGHKNVIAPSRGLPVEEVDAPHALFAALADSGALAIPHQLADAGSRMDWEKWNSEFERVGEIFQARGSYEFEGCPRAAPIFTPGHSLWDALARGCRIGVIASSDHGQTHQARAGVYVADPGGFTREGILAGLRARRTFGATTAAAVELEIAGHAQGEEITLPGPPKIDARLWAPAPIQRMDLVRDNRFVYTAQPGTARASFAYTDMDLRPGQSAYYYVRAQIGPDDFAWSSPIWLTRKQ